MQDLIKRTLLNCILMPCNFLWELRASHNVHCQNILDYFLVLPHIQPILSDVYPYWQTLQYIKQLLDEVFQVVILWISQKPNLIIVLLLYIEQKK